jgi:hypothetical protein
MAPALITITICSVLDPILDDDGDGSGVGVCGGGEGRSEGVGGGTGAGVGDVPLPLHGDVQLTWQSIAVGSCAAQPQNEFADKLQVPFLSFDKSDSCTI